MTESHAGFDAEWQMGYDSGWDAAQDQRDKEEELARALRATDPPTNLLEKLSAIEHEQWVTWARSILSAGDVMIGVERADRWQSYMVPYDQLDEAVKEHDRVWARVVLEALGGPA